METNQLIRILFVEDVLPDVELCTRMIRKEGLSFTSKRVETEDEFVTALNEFHPDVIISDYTLPQFDGMRALNIALERDPALPFIVLTGTPDEETAVNCIKAGATDYVSKERITRLPFAVKEALTKHEALRAQQAAERTPHDGEARFSTTFRVSPVGIGITRLADDQAADANDAALGISGCTREELIEHAWPELQVGLHPEERDRLVMTLSEQGRAGDLETKSCRKSGEIGDARISAEQIELTREQYILTRLQDITERKRAEEALRAAEEKYRTIFDHAVEGIFQSTPDGRFLTANPALARMWGYESPEELISSIKDIAHQVYVEPPRRSEFARLMQKDGEVHGFEFQVRRKDGGVMWVSENARAVRDATGTLLYYEGNIEDITERKRAEGALRTSEDQLSNAMKIARLGHWEYDVAKDLFTFNDHFYAMLRTTAEQVGGYTMSSADYARRFVHPDEIAVIGKEIQKAIETTDPHFSRQLEHRIIYGDGEIGYIAVRFFVVKDSQGRTVKIYGVNQDITDRKQTEQAMRQRLAELEALHTVSNALRTAQTFKQVLPKLLDETLAALETDAGAIWLYDPESTVLRAAGARGWFQQVDKLPMHPGEGIGGSVFKTGQAHYSREFATDPLALTSTRHQIPLDWGGACIPIRVAAETVGVFFVSVPLPRQITPEQMKLLTSLSEIAGATIHRMRLHEETVRRLEHLQAVRAVDQAIAASLDLRVTLNILLNQTLAQLGVDAAVVLLLEPHQRTLKYAASRGFRTRAIEAANIRVGEGFAGRVALERRIVQVFDAETANKDPAFARLWFNEGFMVYQGIPLIAKGEVKGVLEVFHRTAFTPKSEWMQFFETLAGQAAITIDNAQLFEGLQRANLELGVAYDDTIEGWSRAMDLRDKETEGHTQRVAEMTIALASAMGMHDSEISPLRRGVLLHDIGKMGIPDSILLKPDKLTDTEWTIMQKHPQFAYEMLKPIAYLRQSLDIPWCHHEKWDGTGYPRGLKGEQIPLAARIFVVVDVWDALTSDRPYRKAWTRQEALEYIREQSGKYFDPRVVEVFLEKAQRL